jgi:hypothetical protein
MHGYASSLVRVCQAAWRSVSGTFLAGAVQKQMPPDFDMAAIIGFCLAAPSRPGVVSAWIFV